jgi:hypothetical protein
VSGSDDHSGDPPPGQPRDPLDARPRDPLDARPRDPLDARPAEQALAPAVEHELQRIEQLITALVRSAPDSDPAVVDELTGRLRRLGSPLGRPLARPLARSIARVVELVAEQLVAPGIALPPLAMACATLADAMRGRLTDRELEAARYEIETLLPLPDRPPAIASPDVPLSALRKRGP